MTDTLLNVRDVAARLGVCRPTVYNILKRDPSFPRPIHIASRSPRWRAAELAAWIESKRQPRPAA